MKVINLLTIIVAALALNFSSVYANDDHTAAAHDAKEQAKAPKKDAKESTNKEEAEEETNSDDQQANN